MSANTSKTLMVTVNIQKLGIMGGFTLKIEPKYGESVTVPFYQAGEVEMSQPTLVPNNFTLDGAKVYLKVLPFNIWKEIPNDTYQLKFE